MLAYVLVNYDVKMVSGNQQPSNWSFGEACLPDCWNIQAVPSLPLMCDVRGCVTHLPPRCYNTLLINLPSFVDYITPSPPLFLYIVYK